MTRLTEFTTYADAQRHFSKAGLWELFDGTEERFNIAHECLDRHVTSAEPAAIRIVHADGRYELLSFEQISRRSSQIAHYFKARGLDKGDRVAVMIEPSLEFYCALFGVIKAGAVAVPMFSLFGPDGIRLRVRDCKPELFLTDFRKAPDAIESGAKNVVVVDSAFLHKLDALPAQFDWATEGSDLAVLQYTSGTTRALPAAVRHSHRSIVTLMVAALYGTGVRPGDRFFCPSSPAWGHGLWHGTLAPLALGVPTGTYSGKFDAGRLLKALQDFSITNLTAAATHYRMMRNCGEARQFTYCFDKLSFTGEPIDSATAAFVEQVFGVKVRSMYGTTEIGVIIANYPGAADLEVRDGAMGKALPGVEVQVQCLDGTPAATGETGELMVRKRGEWFPTKDLGHVDADGYFYHDGRADDVIISAGWTIGSVEVEDAVLSHPAVAECGVIGVSDALRGLVVKAYIILKGAESPGLVKSIQDHVRAPAQHEYPRQIEFVAELPKTPAGKVNRKVLRDLAAAN